MSKMRIVTNAYNEMLLKLSVLRFLFGEMNHSFKKKYKAVSLINMEEMNSE